MNKTNNYKYSRKKSTLKTNRQNNSIKRGKRNARRPLIKPHETEEEAIIRRFHDAQRMARFRARKKKALEEVRVFKTELNRKDITFKTIDSVVSVPAMEQFQTYFPIQNPSIVYSACKQSKYSQLLKVIKELGRDVKLTYAGSKISIERLKLGIIKARMLIKECLMEIEINLQQ
ncbi:hypothetical protein E2986_01157 [Frieseomelitta varia]|uniref:Uncharacterized protein n=1 Tax=Frieseomelitta varia TaxID=561572 RepID=A0A833W6Q2_9HYME|nr:uncharacterized protein LOC122531225 [Frieseomelitta varia]KAF3425487.1 hypothetical protein E2986_01157 [Frieseomelitta varia]